MFKKYGLSFTNTINAGINTFNGIMTLKLIFLSPCLLVKYLGSGWSTQELEKKIRLRLVFPPTLLSCSGRFLRALQQNRTH